jgi:hypothetical protein
MLAMLAPWEEWGMKFDIESCTQYSVLPPSFYIPNALYSLGSARLSTTNEAELKS